MKVEKRTLGLLGESIMMWELAKRNLYSINLPNNFTYDLLCVNGKRVEVKTSQVHIDTGSKNSREGYARDFWNFAGLDKPKRECDFYAFICLDEELNPESIYIVPKDVIGSREGISIPRIHKQKSWNGFTLKEYKGRFDLIV